MALTENALRTQAERVYELSRLRHSLAESWRVLPIIAVGTFQGSSRIFVFTAGVVLFALSAAFSWRGLELRRAVWPGLLAGAPPLLIPRLASPNSVCWIGGSCWSSCFLLCPLSGLAAGLVLGILAGRHRHRGLEFLAGAALIAAVTGTFGCSVAGALGIVGMLAGGLVGLIPVHFRHQLQ